MADYLAFQASHELKTAVDDYFQRGQHKGDTQALRQLISLLLSDTLQTLVLGLIEHKYQDKGDGQEEAAKVKKVMATAVKTINVTASGLLKSSLKKLNIEQHASLAAYMKDFDKSFAAIDSIENDSIENDPMESESMVRHVAIKLDAQQAIQLREIFNATQSSSDIATKEIVDGLCLLNNILTDALFLQPLKIIGKGARRIYLARLAITAAGKGMDAAIHSAFTLIKEPEPQHLCDYIQALIRED